MSPLRRALLYAAAIACVVGAANLALAALSLSRADALAIDSLASAAVLALVACAIASFEHAPLTQRLGLRRGALRGGQIAWAALGIVGLSHAAESAVRLLGVASPSLLRFDDALGGLGFESLLLPFVAIALASAAGEELFFRGLLQRGVAARLGNATAIAIASLAFGIAHGDWVHGAVATVLGVYLGVVAARADSIRPAIAVHVANNAVALLEKALDLSFPDGPIATPVSLVAWVTLGCVGLATIGARRAPGPVTALQSPPGPAEERSGP